MRYLAFSAAIVAVAASVTATAGVAKSLPSCLSVLLPQPSGTIVDLTAFRPANCPNEKIQSAFRYDQAQHVSRARRVLAVGEIVPSFPEFGSALVRPGDKLRLVVSAGPIRIERDVEAIQTARSGEQLFVRGADGVVFAARFQEAIP